MKSERLDHDDLLCWMKRYSIDDDDHLPIPRNALMKLGFTRLNLTYFADDAEIDFILDALEFINNEGWRFLALVRLIRHRKSSSIDSSSPSSQYTFNQDTAVWHPRHLPVDEQHKTTDSNDRLIDYSRELIEQKIVSHQILPVIMLFEK